MKLGLAIGEAVVWVLFVYYLLFSIKNEVNLWYSAVILVALCYLAFYLCPWFRETNAYKKMMKA
tara:strand:+ start:1195 stop:1386 length:192 start_codon:yes stop_codon:yes gene_type:complete